MKLLKWLYSKQTTEKHNIYIFAGIKFKFIKNIKFVDILNLKYELLNNQQKMLNELKAYISNEVFIANYTRDIHKETFLPYKNINNGKEIVIVATGPTMKYYKPIEGALHIGVNKAYKRSDINFDYLFTIDYSGDKFVDDIVNYPYGQKFLGTQSIKYGQYDFLSKCTIPYYYLNNKNVHLYCSEYPRGLCYPDITNFGLIDFGSIAHSAIHFALFTNPKRIYLVGCDCSSSGYYDGSKQKVGAEYMIEGWQKIAKFIKQYYPNIEIVSINPIGLKGMFTDIYTSEYNQSFIQNISEGEKNA